MQLFTAPLKGQTSKVLLCLWMTHQGRAVVRGAFSASLYSESFSPRVQLTCGLGAPSRVAAAADGLRFAAVLCRSSKMLRHFGSGLIGAYRSWSGCWC